MLVLDDTITALATGTGGSISIIRISGDEAINIIGKIFNKKLEDHRITYGKIIYNEKLIDEVLVSYMKGPKSYTGEDIVEINCHGGIITAKKILDILLRIGCRMATNGEFTKRAFLNGRLDLANSEAIMSIIDAKTEKEQEVALSQLEGELSNEITYYRNGLLNLVASIEASIDYPEHDLEHENLLEIEERVLDTKESIDNLILSYEKGKIIKDGIETAIIGSPNVGKSSFLNRLVGDEVAIVTDIAGTTRDVLKEYVKINGILLKLIDTAGIRETTDTIEKIGVDRAIEISQNAQLILYVLDGSKEVTKEELDLLASISHKKIICLINKLDLDSKLDIDDINQYINEDNILFVSALKDVGMEKFYEKIEDMFLKGIIENDSSNLIVNERHFEALTRTSDALSKVLEGINLGITEDLLSIDLQTALSSLGEILGTNVDDEIIDRIFSSFCLGK